MECSECARNCDLQTDIPHCWGNVQQDEHVITYFDHLMEQDHKEYEDDLDIPLPDEVIGDISFK